MLSHEGQHVGRLMKHHLHLKASIVVVRGSADTELAWGHIRPRQKPPLVCVIGHTAKMGLTLSKAIERARELFHMDRVFGVVLVASIGAVEHFAGAPGLLAARPACCSFISRPKPISAADRHGCDRISKLAIRLA
jgi:hypothetical protein